MHRVMENFKNSAPVPAGVQSRRELSTLVRIITAGVGLDIIIVYRARSLSDLHAGYSRVLGNSCPTPGGGYKAGDNFIVG
jgi:hypothetical protein